MSYGTCTNVKEQGKASSEGPDWMEWYSPLDAAQSNFF